MISLTEFTKASIPFFFWEPTTKKYYVPSESAGNETTQYRTYLTISRPFFPPPTAAIYVSAFPDSVSKSFNGNPSIPSPIPPLLMNNYNSCEPVQPLPSPLIDTTPDATSDLPFRKHNPLNCINIKPVGTFINCNFNDSNDQHNVFVPSKSKLKVIHLNARSLKNRVNLHQIREFTQEHKPNIIAISESWLNSTVTNAEIEIEGFKVIKLYRLRKIGG